MKMIKILGWFTLSAALLTATTGCKDWLEIKVLSEYTGENAFNNYDGMKTAVVMLDRDLRFLEFYPTGDGNDPKILTELFFSEIAVNGRTDAPNPPHDLKQQIIPSIKMNGGTIVSCHAYWNDLYKGIKDANTVISHIDDAKYDNDTQRSEILAIAYWHRAMRYYRLVHQFGDVPLVLKEESAPRYDYYTTKREVVLATIKKDVEDYVKFLPDVPMAGAPGKGAAYHLLTKINLALCDFDAAIASAGAVIDGGVHSLMTQRFGTDVPDPGNPGAPKNVIWDMHRPENKSIPANKEVLYASIDRYEFSQGASTTGTCIMRQILSAYSSSGWLQIRVPGKPAVNGFVDNDAAKDPYLEQFGRGIATARSTWYYTDTIWEEKRENAEGNRYNDWRHDTLSRNWMKMELLKYNNPGLLTNPDRPDLAEWYGRNLVKWDFSLTEDENMARHATWLGFSGNPANDSIRGWVDWPHYKSYIPDQRKNRWRGGNADMYVFRLAETYLLRAEAYVWKGQPGLALADINAVRTRANARPFTVDEVSISSILDERARELYYEEPRKTELARISFMYARTGKATDDPKFPSKTYTLSNLHENNFFYDRVVAYNGFYNSGAHNGAGNSYTVAPRNMLWPVYEGTIDEVSLGHINQTPGYDGWENNIPPIDHAE